MKGQALNQDLVLFLCRDPHRVPEHKNLPHHHFGALSLLLCEVEVVVEENTEHLAGEGKFVPPDGVLRVK